MQARGTRYQISSNGNISYPGVKPSGDWKLFAIGKRWNTSPFNSMRWTEIKFLMDEGKTIKGYVHDIDHGTLRSWGGKWDGKIPVATLWK